MYSCAKTFESKHSEDIEYLVRSDGFSLIHSAVTLIKSEKIQTETAVSTVGYIETDGRKK